MLLSVTVNANFKRTCSFRSQMLYPIIVIKLLNYGVSINLVLAREEMCCATDVSLSCINNQLPCHNYNCLASLGRLV